MSLSSKQKLGNMSILDDLFLSRMRYTINFQRRLYLTGLVVETMIRPSKKMFIYMASESQLGMDIVIHGLAGTCAPNDGDGAQLGINDFLFHFNSFVSPNVFSYDTSLRNFDSENRKLLSII